MLDAETLAELREALEVRRREAGERLAALRAQFAEVVDAAAGSNVDDEHDPEVATIAFERSQVAALAQRAVADLEEVDAALARMAAGGFGVCEVCGEEIPVERLRVRPTARTCVGCAGRAGGAG